jgi:hypothetical protein
MSDTDQNIPGSTLTPTAIATSKVVTNETHTGKFVMSGAEMSGITQDPECNAPDKLVSSAAMNSAMLGVRRDLQNVQNSLDQIHLSPVLSDPILNPFFVDQKWGMDEFYIDLDTLLYVNRKPVSLEQARLRVLSEAFKSTGTHFVYLIVSALPSGKIRVMNEKSELIKEITLPGQYSFEFDVDQPSIAFLDFVVDNMSPNETCGIVCIYVHYVKTAFERYMDYVASKMLSGGSGFASEEFVTTTATTTLSRAQQYTDTQLTASNEQFINHMNNRTDNVHGVTPEMIHAAEEEHTHSAADIIDLNLPTNVSDEINLNSSNSLASSKAVNSLRLDTETKLADKANKTHTHIPGDCGAAPVNHNHVLSDISDLNLLDQQFTDVYAAIQSARQETLLVNSALSTHVDDQTNSHNVTKQQVGLADVVNGPMATEQEAIDGVRSDCYMNPVNNRAVLINLLGGGGYTNVQVAPVHRAKILFEGTSEDQSIIVYPDRIYQIMVNFEMGKDLKNLGMAINTKTSDLAIRNNTLTAKTLDISGQSIQLMGWDKSKDNHYKFMLSSMGMNSGNGQFTFDSSTFSLSGTLHGRILDENYEEVVDSAYPSVISSCPEYPIPESTILESLVFFSIDGNPIEVEITVFELVQTTQSPALVIDATPVGMVVTRYTMDTVPGWIRYDGSELLRTSYPELYNYAVESGKIVSDLTWQDENTTNGYTDNYSHGDDSTTFRVPKQLIDENTVEYKYVKAKYLQIPEGNEILHRYVWE